MCALGMWVCSSGVERARSCQAQARASTAHGRGRGGRRGRVHYTRMSDARRMRMP